MNSAKPQPLDDLPPARYSARVENLGDLCYQESNVAVDLSAARLEAVVVPIGAAGAIRGKLVEAARGSDFSVAPLSANASAGERPVRVAVPEAPRTPSKR